MSLGQVQRLAETGILRLLISAAVAVPPLNPWTPGPSPQVGPLLVGSLCIAVLLVCFQRSCVRPVAWGWLATALVNAVIAGLQYFGAAHYFSPWISQAELGEAYGNLRQRNQLATLENMGLAALVWLVHEQRRSLRQFGAASLAGVVLAGVLLAFGTAASASRIGLVQILALAAFTAFWSGAHRKLMAVLVIGTLLAYLGWSVALPWLLEQTHGVTGQSVLSRLVQPEGCGSRRVLWSNVAHLIALSPWTGWGWGNLDYAHYITLYPGERFCDILDNAHNLPLHLAVELGIPLAVVACSGVFWLVVRAAPWQASRPEDRLAWMVLAVIALHSLVEYPLWYSPFHTAAAVAMVIVAGAPEFGTFNWSRQWAVLRIVLAALLCGGIAFAWREYRAVSQAYLPYEQRDARTRDQLAHVPSPWSPFRPHALFAAVTTSEVRASNAAELAAGARELLHYSPEPRVVEILIESLAASGQHGEAAWHAERYKAAFPDAYLAWQAGTSGAQTSPRPP